MWTLEGRLNVLESLRAWWYLTPFVWDVCKIYLVATDVAESESLAAADAGTWTKYEAASSTATPFTAAAATVAGVPTAQAAEITWNNATGGPVTLYGWATIMSSSGRGSFLMNYKRFDASAIIANGINFRFKPGYTSPLPP